MKIEGTFVVPFDKRANRVVKTKEGVSVEIVIVTVVEK